MKQSWHSILIRAALCVTLASGGGAIALAAPPADSGQPGLVQQAQAKTSGAKRLKRAGIYSGLSGAAGKDRTIRKAWLKGNKLYVRGGLYRGSFSPSHKLKKGLYFFKVSKKCRYFYAMAEDKYVSRKEFVKTCLKPGAFVCLNITVRKSKAVEIRESA